MINISKRNMLHALVFVLPFVVAIGTAKYLSVNHSPKTSIAVDSNTVAVRLDSMNARLIELSLAVISLKSQIREMKDSISCLKNKKKTTKSI